MGQQQLILLALAVVIVGAAIVVGIRAFTENAVRSNFDAMQQDGVRIANDMQAWKQKPAPFGGQAACASSTTVVQDSNDFECANFPRLGYAPVAGLPLRYDNLNGAFNIDVASSDSTAIQARNITQQNELVISVSGITDRDISSTSVCLGGVDDTCTACTVVVI